MSFHLDFKEADRYNNANKRYINSWFARVAPVGLPVLCLDSQHTNTCNSLIEHGHTRKMIHSPNNNSDKLGAYINLLHLGVYTDQSSIEDYLDKLEIRNIGAIFLDLTCTLTGVLAIQNRILDNVEKFSHGMILATTIFLDNRFGSTRTRTTLHPVDAVAQNIRARGLQCSLLMSKHYMSQRSEMMFVAYRITY